MDVPRYFAENIENMRRAFRNPAWTANCDPLGTMTDQIRRADFVTDPGREQPAQPFRQPAGTGTPRTAARLGARGLEAASRAVTEDYRTRLHFISFTEILHAMHDRRGICCAGRRQGNLLRAGSGIHHGAGAGYTPGQIHELASRSRRVSAEMGRHHCGRRSVSTAALPTSRLPARRIRILLPRLTEDLMTKGQGAIAARMDAMAARLFRSLPSFCYDG